MGQARGSFSESGEFSNVTRGRKITLTFWNNLRKIKPGWTFGYFELR
jgi:hypothetical protein